MSSQNLDRRTQFLSAPHIPDGTSGSMRDTLMATIQVWNIPRENVVGMCWDMTVSNMGHYKGSATLFEQELDRALQCGLPADTTLESCTPNTQMLIHAMIYSVAVMSSPVEADLLGLC